MKSKNYNRYFTCSPNVQLWTHLSEFFLECEMFHTISVEKNLCSVTFSKNCVYYEMKWENTVERGRAQMAMWPIRFVWWITRNTNPHWVYVILFVSSLQQLLQECASMLHYKYLIFLVCLFFNYFVSSGWPENCLSSNRLPWTADIWYCFTAVSLSVSGISIRKTGCALSKITGAGSVQQCGESLICSVTFPILHKPKLIFQVKEHGCWY